MLPDYPKLKKDICDVLHVYLVKKIESDESIMQQIPKTRTFEGRSGGVIRRQTGEEDPIEFMKSEANMEIKYDDVPNMTLTDVVNKIDEVARKMAKSMGTNLFKSLSDQLDKAGRTVRKKGQRLSGAVILEVLQNLFIPFDKHGNPELPTIVIHPNMKESMKKAIDEMDEDPDLKRRHDEIIATKREEWRAEEASRRLVG